jgi:hypothetical protein
MHMKLSQDRKFMQNFKDKHSERCPFEWQYYIMKTLYKTGWNWSKIMHAKGQTLLFAIFNPKFPLQVSFNCMTV